MVFQNCFVLAVDYIFHVAGAAVTHFDGVSFEYFVVFVVSWEMFVDEFYTVGADLGDDVLAIWWIEPYYFSFLFVLRWYYLVGCWRVSISVWCFSQNS